MLKSLTAVAIALTLLPVVAGAQQRPVDPYGRPYVMSPPQPTPGDPQISARAMYTNGAPIVTHQQQAQAMAPADTGGGTMRDEYGNLYNSRGDRIDRAGRIMPPPVTPPGARALR